MRRVDPYRTEIYTAEQIDEMLSHIAPSETYSKSEIDAMVSDINDDIDTKQNTLTAGSNVEISEQNVISATDTKYTAGSGIDITDNVISVTGGGGGSLTWTFRENNNDWSDIFDNEDGKVVAKKDLIISYNSTSFVYIPKGLKATTMLIGSDLSLQVSSGSYSIRQEKVTITTSFITSPNANINYKNFTFDFDAKTISSPTGTSIANKILFTIYVGE